MKNTLFLLSFVFLLTNANAQTKALSHYSFEESISTFATIITDGMPIVPDGWDDGVSAPINIGFDFEYNGETYTQVTVNTNGTVNFGAQNIKPETNNLASDTYTNLMAPLWDDLVFGGTEGLYYKIESDGTHNMLIIEFHQVGRYNSTGLVDFQVMLSEADNSITFVYNDLSTISGWHEYSTVSIGMNFLAESTVELISVTPDAINGATISTSVANNDIQPATMAQIAQGTTYKFTPPSDVTDIDIALTEFLSPESDFLTTTENVSVRLSNPGITINEGITLSYQLYDASGGVIAPIGAPVNEIFTNYPFNSLTTSDFTFTQTVDLSNNSQYSIIVTVDLSNDVDITNNEIEGLVNGVSLAPEIFNNGPIVTHENAGADNAKVSVVQTNLNMWNYGYNTNTIIGYRNADDFTIPQGEAWVITGLGFYNWQTESDTISTINHLDFRIFSDKPDVQNADTIVNYYDINKLSGSKWSGIYRVYDTALQNTDRPIMLSVANLNEPEHITLQSGTYWLDWSSGGTMVSGPWVPYITYIDSITTGNAVHLGFAGWENWIEDGTETPQGMPFMLYGERITGISNHATSSIETYPNPSNGIFRLTNQTVGRVIISDLSGRCVYDKIHNEQASINFTHQNKGIYILNFVHDAGTIQQKIVIE